MGDLSVLDLRDKGILDTSSPTGVLTTVQVTPGEPLKLSGQDLRHERDGATALVCARGGDTFRGPRVTGRGAGGPRQARGRRRPPAARRSHAYTI
ncbi:hypothetical protein [Streptomyces sp. NPDC054863]